MISDLVAKPIQVVKFDIDFEPIIVYWLMTDGEGRPIAVEVYAGNTGDPTTVGDQVNKYSNLLAQSKWREYVRGFA